MNRRRLALGISASLALGTLTTLGFAWVPAALMTDGTFFRPGWTYGDDRSGVRRDLTRVDVGTIGALGPLACVRYAATTDLSAMSSVLPSEDPPRVPSSALSTPSPDPLSTTTTIGCGFPFTACTMSRIDNPLMSFIARYEPSRRFTALGDARAIPLRPHWPGLITDTLLWSTLTGLVLVAPGVVRHRRRRARGLCLHCGYDPGPTRPTAGPTCAECGRPLAPTPGRAHNHR